MADIGLAGLPARMRDLPRDRHGRPERWLPVPVPGFEQYYEVSDLGRVWSVRSHIILRTDINAADGHHRVTLKVNGRQHRVMVHHLVLTAFNEHPQEGQCGRHRDGNPGNNAADNLIWGTMLENHGDRERHGRTARGQRNGMAKLTNEQVAEMKNYLARGRSQASLARKYGVDVTTVWRIAHGVMRAA